MEYILQPNQNLLRFGNRIVVNNASMRTSQNITSDPINGITRVLIFGDSVLWGGSLIDQRNLSTEILQRSVSNDFEVLNVSAGSWGPGNWLEYIQEKGLFNADIVILLISSHDLTDIPYSSTAMPNITRPTASPIFASFEFVRRYLIPNIWSRLSKLFPSTTSPLLSNTEKQLLKGTFILNDLIDKIRSTDTELMVVQFWNRDEIIQGKAESNNKLIADIFTSHGIVTIQSRHYFSQCTNDISELFIDFIHPFTPKGQECLASIFKAMLAKN